MRDESVEGEGNEIGLNEQGLQGGREEIALHGWLAGEGRSTAIAALGLARSWRKLERRLRTEPRAYYYAAG